MAAALGLNSAKILNSSTQLNGPLNTWSLKCDASTKFGAIFSSTVPIGIILGIMVGMTPGPFGILISAVFQALAAGTFLHVAFCELIPAELNVDDDHSGHSHESSGSNRMKRIMLIFCGFMMMALLTLFTDH